MSGLKLTTIVGSMANAIYCLSYMETLKMQWDVDYNKIAGDDATILTDKMVDAMLLMNLFKKDNLLVAIKKNKLSMVKYG